MAWIPPRSVQAQEKIGKTAHNNRVRDRSPLKTWKDHCEPHWSCKWTDQRFNKIFSVKDVAHRILLAESLVSCSILVEYEGNDCDRLHKEPPTDPCQFIRFNVHDPPWYHSCWGDWIEKYYPCQPTSRYFLNYVHSTIAFQSLYDMWYSFFLN